MKQNLSSLVIDDDPQIRGFVATVLHTAGWRVSEASTAEQSFEMLSDRQWALVFCDVTLGGADGYAVLRRFTADQPQARVVLMTGNGSAAGALDATAIGAYDYILKPFSVDDILALADAVRTQNRLSAEQEETSEELSAPGYTSDIPLVGKSPAFIECLKLVGRVAPTTLPVLITGESGTGKEVVARAIHRRSNRASNSFVAVNCGAIPVELIESELFGHVRGAFTGAERDRRGLWEEADGGTIFLDEITETSPLFQVKLLRVLQQGEIRRVGSNQTLQVDARVIAATNRNIEEETRQGRFRQDLLYRLNAVTISLPPLRERIEDIPFLAEHFARRLHAPDAPPVTFSSAALEVLQNYQWHGNIRELENVVLHAVSLCHRTVYPEHLPAQMRTNGSTATAHLSVIEESKTSSDLSAPETTKKWLTLAEIEAEYVRRVLTHTSGNKQAAARLLSIDRKTLARIIARHNIEY